MIKKKPQKAKKKKNILKPPKTKQIQEDLSNFYNYGEKQLILLNKYPKKIVKASFITELMHKIVQELSKKNLKNIALAIFNIIIVQNSKNKILKRCF